MDTSAQLRLDYQTGFANTFETEAVPGALPRGRNSPQRAPYGLYAEKLSGTAFTAPREANRQSWLYRIRPSVVHGEFAPADQRLLRAHPYDGLPTPPNQMRWDPLPLPDAATDFVDGLTTMAGTSHADGCAVHIYAANVSMTDRFFFDADGELLIVPQQGRLRIASELGMLEAAPGEIPVMPRGVKFRVELPDGAARGYVCENLGALFRLPELGPIGSNGLANARDFCTPVAAYEDRQGAFTLTAKFDGRLWSAPLDHSPLDVVAWHGNYAPYKYDLARFNAIGSVSFDHPDPSIYTVLTSPSDTPGMANVDFVIFPPRWLVAENTYRPPWFHRNVMSEFMGLVRGVYDGRTEGFVPGGASLHNRMAAHGNDAQVFDAATKADLKPAYLADTLAFMFETRHVYRATRFALETPARQKDYLKVWQTLQKHFDEKRGTPK